ncbi:FAD-dependent oxidoreductase [Erythrobacter crassostreae]|uniref:NADH:ubiquinone reductase (non-electrogenic) n=1 Tax=Erythrobacter crassostreae TaxID=2828328 RepID=A0A9X1F4N1_9SPHN|nr:FAD-dependent oxidoreductase [Erythrobacter crassostrea]MBV7260160.1 FAD-dependent oxidoreductase [Erythrobacter crassostrea]
MAGTANAAADVGRELLQEERLSPFVRVTLRKLAKWYSGGAELFWPFTDLAIRFFVAAWFLRSGIVKASDWDTALYLAANEYPVTWMAPYDAAATGLAIELIGPILLLAGFFTRPAALAMAMLTIVSQAVYIPTTTNLMVASILIWYVVSGPAAFSLDRVLASGLKHSAMPLARPTVRLGEWMRERLAPVLMMLTRIWLAVALFAFANVFEPSIAVATWLPTSIFSGMPGWLAVAFGVLFLVGFAASIVSYVLVFVIGFTMIAGAHPNVTLFPFLLLAIYEARGAGVLSIDAAIYAWMERNILFDRDYAEIPNDWPHIVVVGAGFGGLAAVERLKRLPVRITLIDKRNYHLFQPLLYQIATATLNPADIATPIRSLFRSDANVRVLKGEVRAIDAAAKTVTYGPEADDLQSLTYDQLVLATGATHSYFGKDEWGAFAPGLKTIEDGVAVRASILNAFEQAEAIDDEERIKRLLTFVIVGAGPTGVELAGAIAELAKINVAREFRTIDPATTRVILVQSGPRILPAFPEELSQKAAQSLESLGVEIRTGGRVTEIAERHVCIGDETTIETETVLWAAGVAASPAAQWLDAKTDRSGRVQVNDYLRVHGREGVLNDVFAIGDTAESNAWHGGPVPGLAPAAKQAGVYVSKVVEAELLGKECPGPFVYKHQGSLATIGRKSAVADFGSLKLSGNSAWWLWGLVHVGFLTGMRNRVTVVVNWMWNFFAQHSGVRLITEKQV